MATIAYAAPQQEVLATSRMPQNMRMTWESWDGTVWDIANGTEGVALMNGVRGLNMPEVTRHTQTSPAVHGSRRTGWIANEREVFWPVLVYKPIGDPNWHELDSKFWRSMHPDKPGTWTVTDPDGRTRKLSCVYKGDSGHVTDVLPSVTGWEKYGIYLAAEQPFWTGEVIRRGWSASSSLNFFTGNGDGKKYIASASSTSKANITNPGDLDAWPKWTVIGPSTSTTIGIPGRTITIPFNIPAGKAVEIDTNPAKQTILYGDYMASTTSAFGTIKNTVNKFADMGAIDFAPINAGEKVPLTITINGTGVCLMEIVPRHFRAWGI
jgi:hypothetical protein